MKHTTQLRPADTVDPADYASIVGSTFVKNERQPLLTLGKYTWSRYTLGQLGCPHPGSAKRLDQVFKTLGITSMASLAENAQQIGQYRGLGVTAYWVVLAILRSAGYDVEVVHREDVTYATMKQRAKRAQRERGPKLRKRRAGPPSDSVAEP